MWKGMPGKDECGYKCGQLDGLGCVGMNEHRLGHFLYLGLPVGSASTNNTWQVKSRWLEASGKNCRVEAFFNVWSLDDAATSFKILVENSNYTSITSGVDIGRANETGKWKKKTLFIGRITKSFRMGIEIYLGNSRPTHVAIDNIQLVECFSGRSPPGACVADGHVGCFDTVR
ncbi:uncharacterized protein [Penaeus vannamei]|uniref:uncharacterized protein n=1 Tax=Penaeus vannamei TaxID=6689 RepID=UPI00387F7784